MPLTCTRKAVAAEDRLTYHVEYLVAAPAEKLRAWLTAGAICWTAPELPDALPQGVIAWQDLTLPVVLGQHAALLSVPQIPYGWLVGKHPTSLEQIDNLDTWLLLSIPKVPIVRLEEFLRLEWEERTNQTWDQSDDPVAAFQQWLSTAEADPEFYHFVAPPLAK